MIDALFVIVVRGWVRGQMSSASFLYFFLPSPFRDISLSVCLLYIFACCFIRYNILVARQAGRQKDRETHICLLLFASLKECRKCLMFVFITKAPLEMTLNVSL